MILLSMAALLVGCDGAPDGDDTQDTTTDDTQTEGLQPPEGDAATVELAGECPMATHVGAFSVSDYEVYTIVDGAVSDSIVPVTVLTLMAEDGDCKLLKKENPFCDGGCEPDETCNLDGECVPYPVALDLGTVTVAGLIEDVIMEPVQPGSRYFETGLPHPGFNDGDLLQLRTQGGDHGAFDLHGVGVAPLVHDGQVLVMDSDTDLIVNWEPADGRATVHLTLSIDQHGASPTSLVCDFDDDGQGQVSADLVDQLINAGVTGFPSAALSRQTVDRAENDVGCIDLTTQSRRNPDVRVAGYTPCTSDDDCPDGLTCNLAIEICE
jgi:hypothetical protein